MIPPTGLSDTANQFDFMSFLGACYNATKVDEYTNTPNLTLFVPNNNVSLGISRPQ